MSYYMKLNSYENVEIMLTSDYALIIVNQHIIDKIRLNDVIALELHRDNYYYLILASDDHTMTIKSTSYYDLARLYIALSVLCKNIQIGKYLERISLGKLR